MNLPFSMLAAEEEKRVREVEASLRAKHDQPRHHNPEEVRRKARLPRLRLPGVAANIHTRRKPSAKEQSRERNSTLACH